MPMIICTWRTVHNVIQKTWPERDFLKKQKRNNIYVHKVAFRDRSGFPKKGDKSEQKHLWTYSRLHNTSVSWPVSHHFVLPFAGRRNFCPGAEHPPLPVLAPAPTLLERRCEGEEKETANCQATSLQLGPVMDASVQGNHTSSPLD